MSHWSTLRGPRVIKATWFGLIVIAAPLAGCNAPRRTPLAPLPPSDAIELVNRNVAKIDQTLRASGWVDGHVRTRGRKRTFHLDGVLFFRPPQSLRFDLKSLGQTQLLLGSNDVHYWVIDGTEGETFCGRHDVESDLPAEVPARPDQLIEALGLTTIAAPNGQIIDHRVEARVQRVVLQGAPTDGGLVREYWLDRAAPRLVGRIIFRNARGGVEMDSVLEQYMPLGENGPLLPHRITIVWPDMDARLRIQFRSWSATPEVQPTSVQFRTPRECASDDAS